MAQNDETFSIDTPENVVFGYQVAGIGSRFQAALIDTLLIALLLVVVNFLIAFISGQMPDGLPSLSGWVLAACGLFNFALLWGYYILFELIWNGQSPGKRKVGVRVVRRDGTPVTLTESIIRNLIRLIDFLPFAYGIGVIVMFFDGQSRRLGDLAASTLVVFDRDMIQLQAGDGRSDGAASFEGVPELSQDLPIMRLSDRDIQAVEEYFRRRNALPDRGQLARALLDMLYRRMAVPPPPVTDQEAERLLAGIVRARRESDLR